MCLYWWWRCHAHTDDGYVYVDIEDADIIDSTEEDISVEKTTSKIVAEGARQNLEAG